MNPRAEEGVRFAVRQFIAEVRGTPMERLTDLYRLLEDDGCDGNDAVDLIEAFSLRFSVDMAAYQHQRYFGPEGMGGFGCLVRLLRLCLGRQHPWGPPQTVPITIGDLVKAAETGIWAAPERTPQ